MNEGEVPGAEVHADDAAPCDECAALLRRNVLLGIGLGVVLGAAAVFILTR